MQLWSISCVRDATVIQVKRSFEGKESYSLRDGKERSIEPVERSKRSHEAKDSHSYKDGRSRKRREQEHDNEGRKDKRDLRTKFIEDDAKDDRKHKGEKIKFYGQDGGRP